MTKIMKNNARGLAIAMSAVMALSVSVVPAEAKKATISTTKVTVTVGKTKKVTVKNASKVTWKITSGKANIKLSKKSKKGATIKGKKKGTAKIAVTMKSGKKNIKKTIKVTVKAKKTTDTTKTNTATKPVVTPTASPVATPTATPKATPTATPEATPIATPEPPAEPTTPPAEGYSRVVLDLSQAVDATQSGGITYDTQNKVLKIRDVSLFYFTLPETLPTESNLTVTVKGVMNASNTGDEARGFRCYTITDGEDAAMSDISNSEEDAIDTVGEFTWTFEISTNADCNCIQFKGIQHGISIAELDISQIIVDYKKAAE